MSTSENKKLIQDAFAAWANGDGMAFFNLLADNATWIDVRPAAAPAVAK